MTLADNVVVLTGGHDALVGVFYVTSGVRHHGGQLLPKLDFLPVDHLAASLL